MKKTSLLSAVFILLFLSSLVSAGELKKDLSDIIAKTPAAEKVSVIILFNERPTSADISVIQSDGASIKYQYTIIDAIAAQVPVQVADKIAKRAFVKLVEPDYEVKLVLDKSISQIQANKVWEAGITGKNIDVAVLDTGIRDEHPALNVLKETDYTGEGTDDLHGHGTHVAGIIASTDSTYRGVAYDSNLFNVKVLNQYGSGSGSDVIKGIEWAVDNGAEIISMSLGAIIDNCDGTDAISQAVDKAVSKGVVAVVAVGNSGPDAGTITTPGCSKKGITIGAVDDNDNVPSWSSRGPTDDGRVKPDLIAPGVGIISTWKDNSFKSLSGTSMSTPHVSGVAALLLETDSSLSPDDVKNILKTTALDLGLDENTQGTGRVDAYEAYIFVSNITKEPTNESEEIPENKTKKIPPGLDRKLEKGKGKPGTIGYGLSTAWERIQLAFTFNDLKKSEMYLKFAESRLSESLEVSEDEERERLIEKYEKNLENSKKIAERAREKGKSTDLIDEKIAEATIIHEEILKEVLERVPGQAKLAIQRAIDSSKRGNEEALNALENSYPEKAAEIHFRIAERKLNQAREKAKEGNIEEVEELVEEYEDRMNKSSRVAEIAKGLGNNATNVEQVIAEATSTHLEILAEVHDKVPEQAKQAIEKAMSVSANGREKAVEALKEKDALGNIPEDIPVSEEVKEKIPSIAKGSSGGFSSGGISSSNVGSSSASGSVGSGSASSTSSGGGSSFGSGVASSASGGRV